MAADVPAIGPDQDDRRQPARRREICGQEGDHDREAVGQPEDPHVVAQDERIDGELRGPPAAPDPDDHGQAGHEHGQGREHERGAQDRPDPDRVGQSQEVAEPLDRVGEQLGSEQDDDKRAEQQEQGHRPVAERVRPGSPGSGTQVLRGVRQEGHVAGALEGN